MICFNSSKWFTIASAIVLWVVCALYLILGICFCRQETELYSNPSAESESKVVKEVKIAQTASATVPEQKV